MCSALLIQCADIVHFNYFQYYTIITILSYQENLLDRQEFLRWLVERIETSKPSDDRSLVLYLPMALKVIYNICISVYFSQHSTCTVNVLPTCIHLYHILPRLSHS